jgi:hypothetical protein
MGHLPARPCAHRNNRLGISSMRRDHKRRFSPQKLLPYSGLRRHARGWVTSKLKRLSIVTISSR